MPKLWMTGVLILSVTACNNTPTISDSSPVAVASPTTTTKTDSATTANPRTTFANMKQIVAQTTVAVKTGDFAKAQAVFNNFDDGNWKKVEDSVKAKSGGTYKQVEDNLDEVNNGLKAAKPDKTRVLTALQSLSKTLDGYSKKY